MIIEFLRAAKKEKFNYEGIKFGSRTRMKFKD